MPIFNVYFFGPLRVLIDADSGEVIAVQDRVSGIAAALRYSPAYIQSASEAASRAYASTFEPA